VRKTVFAIFVVVIAINLALAEETSFSRVKLPDVSGRQTKAVLTFNDERKLIEVHPAKGDAVGIAYGGVDHCSYQITRKHRISAISIVTAPLGIGLVIMMTRSTNHWLEIHYHEPDNPTPRIFLLRMDKREYLRILDAFKAHTGIDAEVLGNVYQHR